MGQFGGSGRQLISNLFSWCSSLPGVSLRRKGFKSVQTSHPEKNSDVHLLSATKKGVTKL